MDRTVFFNIECVLCVAADESDDVDMITPMCPLPTECVLLLTECVLYVAADESDDVDMLTPLIPHGLLFRRKVRTKIAAPIVFFSAG